MSSYTWFVMLCSKSKADGTPLFAGLHAFGNHLDELSLCTDLLEEISSGVARYFNTDPSEVETALRDDDKRFFGRARSIAKLPEAAHRGSLVRAARQTWIDHLRREANQIPINVHPTQVTNAVGFACEDLVEEDPPRIHVGVNSGQLWLSADSGSSLVEDAAMAQVISWAKEDAAARGLHMPSGKLPFSRSPSRRDPRIMTRNKNIEGILWVLRAHSSQAFSAHQLGDVAVAWLEARQRAENARRGRPNVKVIGGDEDENQFALDPADYRARPLEDIVDVRAVHALVRSEALLQARQFAKSEFEIAYNEAFLLRTRAQRMRIPFADDKSGRKLRDDTADRVGPRRGARRLLQSHSDEGALYDGASLDSAVTTYLRSVFDHEGLEIAHQMWDNPSIRRELLSHAAIISFPRDERGGTYSFADRTEVIGHAPIGAMLTGQ